MADTRDFSSNLWAATAIAAPETPALQGDAKADVVVVGGGFTGLSTALELAERGADVVLLEAEEPGFGASGRNNGQVIPCYSVQNPDDVVAELGDERGERLNAWVAASADLVFERIRRHAIDCDASQQGWLQPAHAESRLALVRTKHDQWAARGAPVAMFDADEAREMTGSPVYLGGWMHKSGGHVQPLSLARGLATAALAAGARICAGTPATGISRVGTRWHLATPGGSVSAEHVVLATNAYSDALWPGLARTIVPVRAYHVATQPLGDNLVAHILPGNHGFSDTRGALWAFRFDRFGRLVTTAAPVLTAGAEASARREILDRLGIAYPQITEPRIEYVWEGNIAMTPERLPRFHQLGPGISAGLGYSGRGIAMAFAMGRQLADFATGTPAEDLALPPSPLKPLPLHNLIVLLHRVLILHYRRLDARA